MSTKKSASKRIEGAAKSIAGLMIVLVAVVGNAQQKSKSRSTPKKVSEYSTSHSFQGTNIKGKLQEGSLRKIVVENDKSLDDLLGVRKNFADREREEQARSLSW